MSTLKAKCVLCANSSFEIVHNEFRNKVKRDALKCNNCSLIFSSKVFETSQLDLDKFYEKDYKDNYYEGEKQEIKKNFDDKLDYQHLRIDRIKNILNKSQSLLEVGCGPGYFLEVCKNKISHLVGLEKNFAERKYVNEELNIECVESIKDIANEKFDVIIMQQLLEHVLDPYSFIKDHVALLNNGGYLIVEIPDISDPIVSLYDSNEYKSFYFQDPHLYYFSKYTLRTLFSKFEDLEIENLESYQETSFLNHYNWVINNKKSTTRSVAISDDLPEEMRDNSISLQLIDLYTEFNQRYKDILHKEGYGDIILAVIKKV